MRKVVMSLVCSAALAVAWPASVRAQAVETPAVVQAQNEKTAIQPENLPDAVKKTLAGEAYEGWAIEKAFKITEDNKPNLYELMVKKGEETATLQFDEEGNKIEQ